MLSSSFIPIAYIDILSGLLSDEKPFFNRTNILLRNSYINNMNSISNSNNYKRIINKNNEISSERNSKRSIDANTNRLIQKYKLFPFLKKNNLFRVKENSLLNSLSNTNTQTPRNKKKKIEKNIIKNSIFNKKKREIIS